MTSTVLDFKELTMTVHKDNQMKSASPAHQIVDKQGSLENFYKITLYFNSTVIFGQRKTVKLWGIKHE